jgi:hypothetical protein
MAGAAFSGKNMFIGLAIQSAVGAVGTVFEYFQPTAITGVLEEFEFKKSDKRVGTRFAALGRKAAKSVPFDITVELSPDVGRILAVLTGAEVCTVLSAGAVGQHVFTFAEVLPYFTLQVYSAGIAEADLTNTCHQITDCKVDKWDIKGANDGNVLLLHFSGQGLNRTAIPMPTPAYKTSEVFFLTNDQGYGTVKIGSTIAGAVEFDEATEMTLQGDNGVVADRRINGSGSAVGLREQASSLSGDLKVIYNNLSFAEILNYQAGAIRCIVILMQNATPFSGTYNKSLTFQADETLYSGSKVSFDPDLISADLPFDVQNSVNLQFILVNEVLTAYSAVV